MDGKEGVLLLNYSLIILKGNANSHYKISKTIIT